jgi:hypothetical protein
MLFTIGEDKMRNLIYQSLAAGSAKGNITPKL